MRLRSSARGDVESGSQAVGDAFPRFEAGVGRELGAEALLPVQIVLKETILAGRNEVPRPGDLAGEGDDRQFMGQQVVVRGGCGVPRMLKDHCGVVEVLRAGQQIETIDLLRALQAHEVAGADREELLLGQLAPVGGRGPVGLIGTKELFDFAGGGSLPGGALRVTAGQGE